MQQITFTIYHDARLMLTGKLWAPQMTATAYANRALTNIAERLNTEGGDVLGAELAAMERSRRAQCKGSHEYKVHTAVSPEVYDTLKTYAKKHKAPGHKFTQSALVGYMLEN